MAATVTVLQRRKFGNGYQNLVSIKCDSSYPTGGYPITVQQFGLEVINLVTPSEASGYEWEWDYTNKKLKALTNFILYSVDINPPLIAAGAVHEAAISAPDIVVGDKVVAIPPPTLEAGLVMQSCWVVTADEIRVRIQNTKSLDNTRIYSVDINPPSIAADSTTNVAVAVTGVATADKIIAFPPSGLENGLVAKTCWASAADEITVRLQNTTAAAVDGASLTWNFLCSPCGGAVDGANKTWTFLVFKQEHREVKDGVDLSAVTMRALVNGY